jgi:RNA polymerase sigma-70 factor (ECF subfamily)
MMDAATLTAIVDRHAPGLTLYARQWSTAPEDIVQEAFVQLARLQSAPEPIAPWLYRVVRNRARTASRSQQRRQHHETRAAQQQPAWFTAPDESALDAATVAESLQSLPEAEREVITLHLWGQLGFAEISGVMKCSASSAHRWYQSGLERLRERLTPCLKK